MRYCTIMLLLACVITVQGSNAAEVDVRGILIGSWELLEGSVKFQSRLASPEENLTMRFHENGMLDIEITLKGKIQRISKKWSLTDKLNLYIEGGLGGKNEFTPAFFDQNTKMVLILNPGEAWLLRKK